jgi:hypothetical protein
MLAQEFVFAYLAVSAAYGRPALMDFRVQAARRRYVYAVAAELYVPLQKAA